MKSFLRVLYSLIVFGLVTLSADGQALRLPALSPMEPRPLLVDTLTTTIQRSEYIKLELARKTLSELSFTDIDQVITTQQSVITECEQALNQVVQKTGQTIKVLQDSLSSTHKLVQRSTTTNEQVTTTVSQTRVRLSNFNAIIRDAKRFVWVQRLAAFGIGTAFGVLLPPGIKLITALF